MFNIEKIMMGIVRTPVSKRMEKLGGGEREGDIGKKKTEREGGRHRSMNR